MQFKTFKNGIKDTHTPNSQIIPIMKLAIPIFSPN